MPPRIARIACPVFLVLICVGAFLPGHQKHLLLDRFPLHWRVDKVAHAVGFMAATLSLEQSRHRRLQRWHIAVLAVLLGAFTELGQVFIKGRTPAVADVLIDAGGALLGLFLSALITQIAKKCVAVSEQDKQSPSH